MPATLTVTRKTIGVEVRRGTYDILVDGKHVGSIEPHGMFETPVEPGRHTLQIRNGRNSSRPKTFDAAEDEVAVFHFLGHCKPLTHQPRRPQAR